jgi:NADH-quinone oxidoreductase subunit H
MKEDFIPAKAHKLFYLLAPIIPVGTAVITPAVIPWFGSFDGIVDTVVTGTVLDIHVGLLFLFAIGSLSVYGVVLGSWGSNSKFSLLGGLRSSAMMISYEVAMGLAILGLVLCVGSFNLTTIVNWQADYTWGIFIQPIGFFLFLASQFAETGRTPFDVAEGESEIVGGFHTEYSAAKFALFFMGEYAHIVIASALIATLFMGGYDLLPIPGFGTAFIADHLGWVLLGLAAATGGVFFLLSRLVGKAAAYHRTLAASNSAKRAKEYGLFRNMFLAAAVASIVGGLIVGVLIGSPTRLDTGLHAGWVAVIVAFIQIGVVMGKTLFFCWLFVWVRWTLPRLRYDQIMGLGWKVMLNIALVNLLITAVVVRLITGDN